MTLTKLVILAKIHSTGFGGNILWLELFLYHLWKKASNVNQTRLLFRSFNNYEFNAECFIVTARLHNFYSLIYRLKSVNLPKFWPSLRDGKWPPYWKVNGFSGQVSQCVAYNYLTYKDGTMSHIWQIRHYKFTVLLDITFTRHDDISRITLLAQCFVIGVLIIKVLFSRSICANDTESVVRQTQR